MGNTEVFDIAESRTERVKARAARREGRGDVLLLRFAGTDIAEIGPEFPLDVVAPLQDINLDLALLVRQAMEVAASQDGQADLIALFIDILASNPDLPREVLDALQEMSRRLLGNDGYRALVEVRPSPWDVAAIASRLMDWYGLSLGEFSGSSTPATDGETSKPISNAGTNSTSAPSGETLPLPDSSESADSAT